MAINVLDAEGRDLVNTVIMQLKLGGNSYMACQQLAAQLEAQCNHMQIRQEMEAAIRRDIARENVDKALADDGKAKDPILANPTDAGQAANDPDPAKSLAKAPRVGRRGK